MASAEFVHLHGHSEYSLLDGGCHMEAMAPAAAQLGMSALAVTDHGNLFGAISHYRSCRDAGVKPILGCEVYVAIGSRHERKGARGLTHGSNHLVLLAKNETGWRNLVKLVSRGYTEGFYYNPRIDKELLRSHSEGLVCLSACVSGEVAHLIQEEGVDTAEEAVREYLDIFGDDYYLEIQRHGIDIEAKVNDGLLRLHKKMGVPLVATNDFHFLSADDHEAHDALICIQTGKMISDTQRMCYPTGLYMKSPQQMQELFSDLPQAIENTAAIAEKCDVSLEFGALHMPNFPIPPSFESDDGYLRHLAQEGMEARYDEVTPEIRERLAYELEVITKEGFSGYFLIVRDFVQYARDNNVSVGPGRGSAAGCLVSYCLRITDTDPIRHDLLFERFLNPERVSPPDIDIDFADTGRDLVLRYMVDTYGEQNVSQVITFGTMGAKSVVRDVGRVLGMGFGEVDRIAKLVPNELKITLGESIERVPELKQMSGRNDAEGQLLKHALRLEGLSRHASVHACAVIIAPSDLTDYVPLYRAPKDGTITTQFDGETCADVGLLKMDILGLRELSLMDEAVRLIRLHTPDFDLGTVPWDDRATFDLFSRGETVGVFQFESSGMREYLSQLHPDRIEDIIAMSALYRPGPMVNIPTFIARKHGREEVVYDHPKLEPILDTTYGIMVYQEQVMRIARDLAGFSMGQADVLRKAMGKKSPEEMAKTRKGFVGGCEENGVDRKVAEKLFADIEVFAGYAFNKSHAACYSEVAYKNAYLKANFPRQYMAASLTTDRNNTDRLTILLDECRQMEIPVLPPDVNESAVNFVPTEDGIHFGLAAIKNVGEGAAESIVEGRINDGPGSDLYDFCERLDLRAVNRRVVEALISAGGLDGFEGHRAQKLEALDMALRNAQNVQEERGRGQFNLFGGDSSAPAIQQQLNLPDIEPWTETEQLAHEKELLGFYVSSHPLSRFQRDLRMFATPISDVMEGNDGEAVRIGGLISRISTSTDRRGNAIAFVTLEDLKGKTDIVFFADAFTASRDLIVNDRIILVEGRLNERNGS
ncbi:MAG: DNA polymerase III subunit alpha, partial [Gemmatimonadetes bacterium]|nr:DNA polymerase III subunit alpha [Gemmatimonadota bacterium]